MSYLPIDPDEQYISDAEQGQDLRYAFQEKRPKRQLSPLQRSCRILAPIFLILASMVIRLLVLDTGSTVMSRAHDSNSNGPERSSAPGRCFGSLPTPLRINFHRIQAASASHTLNAILHHYPE